MTELAFAPPETVAPPPELVEAFAQDPLAVLAQQSQELFGVYHDTSLSDGEKDLRLDGYFRLIESLDRVVFPDMEGELVSGVPQGYVPDGFIDLGSVDALQPSERYGRPMNYVDTYDTLQRHKELFTYLFTSVDPDGLKAQYGETYYQQMLITNVAQEISASMLHGFPAPSERGGLLRMSTVTEVDCQQSALTAQILLQALGAQSRLSKNFLATQDTMDMSGPDIAGGDHVSNVVTVDGQQYMLDTHNPQQGAKGEWMFGLFRMHAQMADGSWLVDQKYGGQRKYQERNNMYWTVQRQP